MVPLPDLRPLPARERVLRAAADLFYADGYGVSIDSIAERAGVAKPTVYAHFASKDALIEAVLEAAADEWFNELDAEIEHRAGDPVSQLTAPFDLLVEDLPDPAYHGCVFVNSAASFAEPSHPAKRALASHHARMLERFERLARAAETADPGATARALLLLYDGVKVRGIVDSSGVFADDARAAAAALVEVISD
jgi:AcrR family transcriptional regulator